LSQSFFIKSFSTVLLSYLVVSTPQANDVALEEPLTYKEWSFEQLAASVPTSLAADQTLAPLYQQMTTADSYLFWCYLRLYNHTEQDVLKNKLTVLRHYWKDKTLAYDLFQSVTSFLDYRRLKEYNTFDIDNKEILKTASHRSIPTPQEIVDSPFSHLDYGIKRCPQLPQNNKIRSISSFPHTQLSTFNETFESLFKDSILNSSALESLTVTFEKISDIQEFNQMTSLGNLHVLKIRSIRDLALMEKRSKLSWMETLYDGLKQVVDIQELHFINCYFTQRDLTALITFLSGNQTLKVLKLGSTVFDGDIVPLYKTLAESPTLTALDLESNNETDSPEIMGAFSSILEKNISLKSLKAYYFDSLGSILKGNHNLKDISIDFISPVSMAELTDLSQGLTTMASLEKVALRISSLDGEGKEFLLKQFCELPIPSASLSLGLFDKDNSHRKSILNSLHRLLESNKVGPRLSLTYSKLNDSDIAPLIQALGHNKSLKTIDLASNNMTAASAQALYNLVDPKQDSYNSSLQTIDLSHNEAIDYETYLGLRNATTPCTFIVGSDW